MKPTRLQLADAILQATALPRRDRFTPKEVREQLQRNGFEGRKASLLSAQIRPEILAMTKEHILELDRPPNQTRNVPIIILDRTRLENIASGTRGVTNKSSEDQIFKLQNTQNGRVLREQNNNSVSTKYHDPTLQADKKYSGKPISMIEILSCDALFCKHYCLPHVESNLGKIPTAIYRKVVLELYRVLPFSHAASPRFWTPEGSEQPLLVIGKMDAKGRMQGARFGLTADIGSHKPRSTKKMYFWMGVQITTDLHKRDPSFGTISSHNFEEWRAVKGKPADETASVLTSVPLTIYQHSSWFVNALEASNLNDHDFDWSVLPEVIDYTSRSDGANQTFNPICDDLGLHQNAVTPLVIDQLRHPEYGVVEPL